MGKGNSRKQQKRAGRLRAAWILAAWLACVLSAPLLPPPFTFLPPAAAQFWHREQNSTPQGRRNSNAGQKQRGQNAGEHRSFWDRLFGRFRSQPRERQPQRPAAPDPSALPKTAAAVKNANARRVLVIGDFTAAALAEGLTRAYSDNADIIVRAKTENNSGLSRTEIYNWPASVAGLIAQEKPDLIIIMLGANDRRPLSISGKQFDFGAEDWTKAYKARLQALAQALQKTGIAWIMAGLPPFKQDNLNEAALAFNRLFKQAAEQSGGHFIDIWEGFVDPQGKFALSGYDINGQTARLRNNDGVNFTLAGRRKLAFYAEQAIELLWGDTMNQPVLSEPENSGKLFNGRVAPVNPLDIGAAGKPILAGGAAPAAKQAEENPESGRKAAEKKFWRGRADDFSLAPAAP